VGVSALAQLSIAGDEVGLALGIWAVWSGWWMVRACSAACCCRWCKALLLLLLHGAALLQRCAGKAVMVLHVSAYAVLLQCCA
jgi:hypothetical protein